MKPKTPQQHYINNTSVSFIKTEGIQKGIVLKLLANIKREISISVIWSLKYLKRSCDIPTITCIDF